MRMAAHGGGHGHHGAGGTHHHATGSAHHTPGATARHQTAGRSGKEGDSTQIALAHSHTPGGVLLGVIGAQKAPLPIVLESYFLMWGFFGFWANRIFVHTSDPNALQMLPSFGVALVAGVLGARGAAEVVSRVLPPDESAVLSREGLFGLTGKVTFPVSEAAGRIFLYDEYGTLHDESCRVVAGQPEIEKGRSAIVLDIDEKGNLIVKETVDLPVA